MNSEISDFDFDLLKPEEDLNKLNLISIGEVSPKMIYDDIDEYKKKWGNLDKFQKINRLMEFAERQEISLIDKKKLKELLLTELINKSLNKKSEIDYNETEGKVINITNLNKNELTNEYYIGTKSRNDFTIVYTPITEEIKTGFKKLNMSFINKK